ncbi:MAG: FAD:protein FMN transferase [Clostridia bacterium]|nr:FAD:protein FMN transferase [Clostridia bacterium]
MKKAVSIAMVLALVVLQVLTFASCKAPEGTDSSTKAPPKTKFSSFYFDYFDTATTIIGYTETKEEFDAICSEITTLLNEYHRLFTIYNRYENVTNLVTINDLVDGEHQVVKVAPEIIDMLSFAKDMYNKTNGKVNVAMGSVLSIWHVYRNSGLDDPENAKLPPMEKLAEAQKHTDINNLVIDKENSTVYLADPLMKLDVGAIAKGYAVEKVGEYLEAKGIDGFLINVGGNIRTVGHAGSADAMWKAGIENPDKNDEEKPYIEYLQIAGESIVTSGSYQRFYVVNGENYHHIIDPETLMPGDKYRSVSVVTNDSGLGDAYSTALFLMSYEEGLKLVEATDNIEAMWVMPDGEQRYSSGFEAYTFEYIPTQK